MPVAIPESLREGIQVKIELSIVTKDIASRYHIPLRTVQEYAKNWKHYGTVRPPKDLFQGRPRTITPEMEEVYLPSFGTFTNSNYYSITFSRTLRHTLMSRLTFYGIYLMSR